MSKPPIEITATDWLKVRNAVANELRSHTTSNATRSMAEGLLGRGWIDVDAVLDAITTKKPDPPTGDGDTSDKPAPGPLAP